MTVSVPRACSWTSSFPRGQNRYLIGDQLAGIQASNFAFARPPRSRRKARLAPGGCGYKAGRSIQARLRHPAKGRELTRKPRPSLAGQRVVADRACCAGSWTMGIVYPPRGITPAQRAKLPSRASTDPAGKRGVLYTGAPNAPKPRGGRLSDPASRGLAAPRRALPVSATGLPRVGTISPEMFSGALAPVCRCGGL